MPARHRISRSKPCRSEVTAPDGDTATTEPREYGLPPGFVQEIEGALDDHRFAEVEERLAPLHSADLAALIEALHPDDRRVVVGLIRVQLTTDAEALTWLNEDVREEVLDLLGPRDVAAAVQELDFRRRPRPDRDAGRGRAARGSGQHAGGRAAGSCSKASTSRNTRPAA
jgi:hypothetical protein